MPSDTRAFDTRLGHALKGNFHGTTNLSIVLWFVENLDCGWKTKLISVGKFGLVGKETE